MAGEGQRGSPRRALAWRPSPPCVLVLLACFAGRYIARLSEPSPLRRLHFSPQGLGLLSPDVPRPGETGLSTRYR